MDIDVSVLQWIVIIGLLLVSALLLRVYRRRKQGNRVRMVLRPPSGNEDLDDDDLLLRAELPHGGARTIDNAVPDTESGAAAAPQQAVQEVLLLHVVSREPAGFAGTDILQVLLAFELRFGAMNFFHRHQQAAGRGPALFSVANMVQPGIFDIDAMTDLVTSGLTFFLSLPGPPDPMAALDCMLESARGVAQHLGGDILDETRSAVVRQTLEHMRQRVRDCERSLLAQAAPR